MRDFAVIPLILADEVQSRSSAGKVRFRIQRKRRPHRIPAKKPCETWPLTHAGGPVSCDQALAEIGIVHQSLYRADSRPVVGLLQGGIWQLELNRLLKITAVVIR